LVDTTGISKTTTECAFSFLDCFAYDASVWAMELVDPFSRPPSSHTIYLETESSRKGSLLVKMNRGGKMDKAELRFKGKQILGAINLKERQSIEAKMHHHLFESDLWKKAKVVGVTLSQSHEWSTEPIIEEGWREGKKMVVPKCSPKEKQMEFYQLDHYDQLERVYFGLREPKPEVDSKMEKGDIELLLVPGLLFDAKGYRVGYGGGYYDRFIEGYRGKTMMVASTKQKINQLPFEEYDQRVEYILTEAGIQSTYQL
jgi:5-formyltetrahydrofolate cyclo-ligase